MSRKIFHFLAATVFSFGLIFLVSGCHSMGGSGGKTYHAGPFTMNLPHEFKAVPASATNSYVGAFQSPGVYLEFDYGIAANNFEDWPQATEFEMVTVDEKEARIGTVGRGFQPGYNFSTQIAFRDTGGSPLTITAACKTSADCARAKEIFRSVKFKPTSRE
ncbi:MAG TPA: hypothetical protein VH413_04540 [Verrucomicrobiae bacterium]|jgi:hypothetical protein|nr:hypothetical protein [Verrucomicrobiae bacterium]